MTFQGLILAAILNNSPSADNIAATITRPMPFLLVVIFLPSLSFSFVMQKNLIFWLYKYFCIKLYLVVSISVVFLLIGVFDCVVF